MLIVNAPNSRLRLDQELVNRKLAATRSQAESLIGLGMVKVNKITARKPSQLVNIQDKIALEGENYVSRAAYKLESVAKKLKLDFLGKTVLDVGSSTGGFSDYALQHGAKQVIAVDVGSNQMHSKLRNDSRIELHEKTDIRQVCLRQTAASNQQLAISIEVPDIVLIDVSFISLRDILPHISKLITHNSIVVAMVKPQFEAGKNIKKNRGVIKNERQRRDIFKDFEHWVQKLFKVVDKSDSSVAGTKGNLERFYLLRIL